MRILTETVTSPTLGDQLKKFLAAYPNARWHQYDPANRDNVHEGAKLSFGSYAVPVYHFDKADVIVSLDGDFLQSLPGSVRYARDFSTKRNAKDSAVPMNRLYSIESTPTLTGAMADHRVAVGPFEVEAVAWSLARAAGISTAQGGWPSSAESIVGPIVKELMASRGRGVVVVGDEQPPVVHALGHAINQAIGAVGTTVTYVAPIDVNPVNHAASLAELCADIDKGAVSVLIVLGGNPIYNAPADLKFTERFKSVANRIHWGLYDDETANLSHWHVPAAHYLESWSDARAFDGTVSIIQPLIAPMYGGRTAHEIVATLAGDSTKGYDIVRNFWNGGSATPRPLFPIRRQPPEASRRRHHAAPAAISKRTGSVRCSTALSTRPLQRP